MLTVVRLVTSSTSIAVNFLGHVFIREQPARNMAGVRAVYTDQAQIVGDEKYSHTDFEMDLWTNNVAELEAIINLLPSVTKITVTDANGVYERALAETGSIWRSSPINHGYRKKRFTLRAIAQYPWWTKVGSSGTKHYL